MENADRLEKTIRASICWRPKYKTLARQLANRYTNGSVSNLIQVMIEFYLENSPNGQEFSREMKKTEN